MQDWSYVKCSEEKCELGLSFSSSNNVYCRSTVFLYNKQKWERDSRTAPFYSHKDWKDFNRLIVNRVPISTCAFDFNNQTATIEHMKLELYFKVIHVSGEFSWRPHAVMDNSSLNWHTRNLWIITQDAFTCVLIRLQLSCLQTAALLYTLACIYTLNKIRINSSQFKIDFSSTSGIPLPSWKMVMWSSPVFQIRCPKNTLFIIMGFYHWAQKHLLWGWSFQRHLLVVYHYHCQNMVKRSSLVCF